MVTQNRAVVRCGEMQKRRDVGSYESELDILTAMLKEHSWALRVRFKVARNLPLADVGGPMGNDIAQDDSSILLENPDWFKVVDIPVRRRWLHLEEASQSPTYVWERLSKPQARTINAVNATKDAVEDVLDVERRGLSIALSVTF